MSVWAPEPDGDPLGAFPRIDRRVRDRCRPTRWCCRRTACRSAGFAVRVAQLRAHHDARLAELAAAVDGGAGAAVSAADVVPVLFRRELDLQQRYFAMGEAIAHLNHLWHGGRIDPRHVAADGAIRFASASCHVDTSQRTKAQTMSTSTKDTPRPRPPRPATATTPSRSPIARAGRRQERQADRRLRRAPGQGRRARSSPTSSGSARRSWRWPRRCSRIRTSSPKRR